MAQKIQDLKIENDAKSHPGQPRYEVLVSFDNLEKGDVFTAHGDTAWEDQHVRTGYLRKLDEETPDGRDESQR